MNKSKVVIARKWNNPVIRLTVETDGISVEMELADFVAAMADESAELLVLHIAQAAPNPSLWFTKERLSKELVKALKSVEARMIYSDAATNIVTEAKKQTIHV